MRRSVDKIVLLGAVVGLSWSSAVRAQSLTEVFASDGSSGAPGEVSTPLAPAVVAVPSTGRMDLFIQGGAASDLRHKVYEQMSGWSEWESLGGVMTGRPSATAWEAGRVDVVVRGSDSAAWWKFYDERGLGGWSDWTSLGGYLLEAPAVTSWGPGRLDAFAQGGDRALWHRAYHDGTWDDWESLGGFLTSAPAATSTVIGTIDVYARGASNDLLHFAYDERTRASSGTISSFDRFSGSFVLPGDLSFSNWRNESLGGYLNSAPAVTHNGDRIFVAARGSAHELMMNSWNTTTHLQSGWTRIADERPADPFAPGLTRYLEPAVTIWWTEPEYFATDTDSHVWHKESADYYNETNSPPITTASLWSAPPVRLASGNSCGDNGKSCCRIWGAAPSCTSPCVCSAGNVCKPGAGPTFPTPSDKPCGVKNGPCCHGSTTATSSCVEKDLECNGSFCQPCGDKVGAFCCHGESTTERFCDASLGLSCHGGTCLAP